MNEVKKPRRSMLYYYGVIILVMVLFNFVLLPIVAQRQIQC